MASSKTSHQHPFSSPVHHERLVHTAAWLLVIISVVVVICFFIFHASIMGEPADSQPTNDLSARQELLLASNPPANLTPAETQSRTATLKSPNPKAQLSAEETAKRRALLEAN